MLRNMLDTNLCIRLLRDRPQGLRPRFNAEAETLCLSIGLETGPWIGVE
jgi:tRNA(fMet)-specific endonuclease VapC